MALAYAGAATSATTVWGARQATVTGIVVASRDEDFSNPKELLMNSQNTPIGFATNIDKRHVIALSGEINATTGVMAATFLAAITYANSAAQLGATNELFGFDAFGDFYLDNPKLSESRSGWKTFSADFTRFANGTGVAITGVAS